MQKISLLLVIPIVLATSLVFGSLNFSVYGQESQTIQPLGNQTTNQTAPATADNSTSPQAAPATADNSTSPQAAPATADNSTSPQAAPATADNSTSPQAAPATADNSTSPQNNQTSSSSSGNLLLESILKYSNGAVIANSEGNGTGVTENLLKLQEYLKSASGDKVISLPVNQKGSG